MPLSGTNSRPVRLGVGEAWRGRGAPPMGGRDDTGVWWGAAVARPWHAPAGVREGRAAGGEGWSFTPHMDIVLH